jgi:hypothetical protein
MMHYVKKSREDDNDVSEYENFEALALRLKKFDAEDAAGRLKN